MLMASSNKPVILVACANDPENPLMSLYSEVAGIRKQLKNICDAGLCELVIIEPADTEQVLHAFKSLGQRIAIFHFAGHANSYQLFLESILGEKQPAYISGLASFLQLQYGLQLVFLNACSTSGHVQDLIGSNVSAVISTSQDIDEGLATFFSINFYESLGLGKGIEQSFLESRSAVAMRYGKIGKSYYRNLVHIPDSLPLELNISPGCEVVKTWNIPEAAGNPLFWLPPLPAKPLPENPFRYFQWYTEEDASLFFGRSREIRQLYELMTGSDGARIIHLYGKSGVGKSSLLAAGLIPRMVGMHSLLYLRWEEGNNGLHSLADCWNCNPDPESLYRNWLAQEKISNKPVSLILDQFEGVLNKVPDPVRQTDPSSSTDQLQQFIEFLQFIQSHPEKTQGRIILSYRKEFLAELEDRFYRSKIDYEKLFLDDLRREGIYEAITGITRIPALQQKYQLVVEEGLPEKMAFDLLRQSESLVTPILQVVLSKLWFQVKDHPPTRRFTHQEYDHLVQGGMLLSDFLDEKMAEIGQTETVAVQSGLLLDLLRFHTTSNNRAANRTEKEIQERYTHVIDQVQRLLQALANAYLLSKSQEDEETTYRLAHDVLAPIIRQKFDRSELPGQRARNILDHRLNAWKKTDGNNVMTPKEVHVVQSGLTGTGMLNEAESRFLNTSKRITNRQRLIRRILAGTGIMLLGILTWSLIMNERNRLKVLQAEAINARQEATIAQQSSELMRTQMNNLLLQNTADSLQNEFSQVALANAGIQESYTQLSKDNRFVNLQAEIIELLANYSGQGFSGALYVEKEQTALITQGFGFAQKSAKVLYSESTVFDVTGFAEQFTAAAILKLINERKISLSDPLQQFFPDIPVSMNSITIRNLLTKSTGLPELFKRQDEFRKISQKTFISRLLKADLRVGGEDISTSPDYSILALIVESVSGTAFPKFIKDQVFLPAGLQQSGFRGLRTWPQKELAEGYGNQKKGYQLPQSDWPEVSWSVMGSGGVLTSLQDMILWKNYLIRKGLLQEWLDLGLLFREADHYFIQEVVGDYGQYAGFIYQPKSESFVILISNSYRTDKDLVHPLIRELERIIARY